MIWIVFLKEFKELLRDRKHLMVTILLPIFVTPLMMYAIGALQAKAHDDVENQVLSYVLFENKRIEGFQQALSESKWFSDQSETIVGRIDDLVREELLDVYIVVDQSDDQYFVTLQYKSTALGPDKLRRLKTMIDRFANEIVANDLFHYGVDEQDVESFLNPIMVNEDNLASKQESTGQALGTFLPFFVILWIISSAIAISSDLIAGEKERGTLETLIISPVPLLSMITGKWLAVTLSSWFAGVLTFISLWGSAYGIAFLLDIEALGELISALSPMSILLGVILMLPTAGLVSAIFLVSGSIAQSFKEAQSYASGIMMLFFVPLFATMSGTLELTLATSLIPIMNTSLAFTELMKGTLNFGFMVPVVLVNTVVIFAVLTFAMSLYRSEKVLSRN
jgi:sodium transport system permease protein